MQSRKYSHKMTARLIFIHNMIKSGTFPDKQKLLREYSDYSRREVSLSAISRDIRALKYEYNAQLEYNKEKKGYYYLEPFELPINKINAEQTFYLSLCKSLLAGLKGTPVINKIHEVIDFISSTGGNGCQFADRIGTLPKPYSADVPQEKWDIIMDSLKFNKIIEFDYTGRYDGKTKHRRTRPYQFLLNDGTPMLFCYDELAAGGKGGERLFALSRMKDIKDTGRTFTLPENYDFASRCRGGRFGMFISDSYEEYEIDLYFDARYLVRECIWADDQVLIENDEKNCTKIKFTSAQYLKVLEWVLARADCAIPRKPQRLVDLWKHSITNMKWNMDNRL